MHIFSVHPVEIEELPPVASFADKNLALFFALLASEAMGREYRVYLDRQLIATFRCGKECSPAGAL